MFQILKAEKTIGFMRWSKVAFVFFNYNDCCFYLHFVNQVA
ncbi:export membrane protein SecF [Vibrio sp. JCM 19053]|nr:export membrane protein SecF [Vibrio sp. JCM 19053]